MVVLVAVDVLIAAAPVALVALAAAAVYVDLFPLSTYPVRKKRVALPDNRCTWVAEVHLAVHSGSPLQHPHPFLFPFLALLLLLLLLGLAHTRPHFHYHYRSRYCSLPARYSLCLVGGCFVVAVVVVVAVGEREVYVHERVHVDGGAVACRVGVIDSHSMAVAWAA